nr:hypothetical protein [Tanacetum cinerariifolium]
FIIRGQSIGEFTTSHIYSTMVSPCLCSDDLESDTEMRKRHVSPTPHDAMHARWRSRVVSRSSSPTTSTSEIPTAPTLRYTSYHLDHFTSGSSSDQSSSDHSSSRHSTSDNSSSGHSTSGHSLSIHTLRVTTIADSSISSRFFYLPIGRTSWYSKAYCCWRSALLSNMYLPTTPQSSAGDSYSESSARPSHKRCRSPATTVTLSIPTLGGLVPSHADLLLPRKRFRDSISPEDIVEEDIDVDVLTDIEADATSVVVATDMDVEARVDAGIGMEVDVEVDVEDEVEGEVESSDRGTMEVGVDVVDEIDIPDEAQHEASRHLDDEECKSRQVLVTPRLYGEGPQADL